MGKRRKMFYQEIVSLENDFQRKERKKKLVLNLKRDKSWMITSKLKKKKRRRIRETLEDW